MERLTHKRSNGIKSGYWSPAKKEELVQRLAAYEDTGVTPDEFEIINQEYTRMARELSILRGRLSKETSRESNGEITVSELIKLLDKDKNKRGASGKERISGLIVNGVFYGYITSAKLDGWGDGLVTDVYLELKTEMEGDEQAWKD